MNLIKKDLVGKDSKNKMTFSKGETDNTLHKSFIQKFLSSLKAKMYGRTKDNFSEQLLQVIIKLQYL